LKGVQVADRDQVEDRHVKNLAVDFKSPDEELLFLTAFVQLGPNGPVACEGAAVGGGDAMGGKVPL